MRSQVLLRVLALLLVVSFGAAAQIGSGLDDERRKKKKKPSKKDLEPVTQVLPLPKDLPAAISAEPQRLAFDISPLSNKGLLTQQTRDAIKALWASTKGATIVKLRVFVAGSGDTRRIQTLVSEMFTEKHLPLPVVSTVLVGSLGMEGAQVLIESVAVDRKATNPNGLLFISGKGGKSFKEAVNQLQLTVKSMGSTEADVLRVTCYVNSFEAANPDRQLPSMPAAAYTVVQMRREPSPAVAECEGIARAAKPQPEGVKFINPAGLPTSPNFSQLAAVNAPKIVFTGLQLAFQSQEADVKLAFDRLGKTLEGQGVSYKNVFMTSIYALTQEAIDRVRAVRFGYLDKANPPAATLLPFEGLPSLDASFGIEVVAVSGQ
jgi:enamine deaminase RidA (YjgF/YER057c/UK114 family)